MSAGEHVHAAVSRSPRVWVTVRCVGVQAQDDDGARRKRGAAAAAHAQLRAAGGDALSALNALCAFERSGRSEAFCRCAACSRSSVVLSLAHAVQHGLPAVCASCSPERTGLSTHVACSLHTC